jgi:hypothetical protein
MSWPTVRSNPLARRLRRVATRNCLFVSPYAPQCVIFRAASPRHQRRVALARPTMIAARYRHERTNGRDESDCQDCPNRDRQTGGELGEII